MLGDAGCMLPLILGGPQCFGLAFHTRLISRASWYAPPDTGVSGLQLVAIEYLPSIEGADRICRSAPFCGEIIFICSALGRGGAEPRPYRTHPKGSPCRGAVSRRLTERLYQTCSDLSVSASPSHLPWKGRLWAVLICKIIRHYGNIDIYAKHSTLRYNNPPIPKEALALPRWFWYPETS